MSNRSGLNLRRRNPDVLTSIANLSNDEVFTPPSFANRMLDEIALAWARQHDGASIWEDVSVTFIDPFSKSGVFLREVTNRLVEGLAGAIPDRQARVNHILTRQVFGIAVTELTSLLSRRSVYCSKWANGEHSICTAFDNADGNIWFKSRQHVWVGGTQRVLTAGVDGKQVERFVDGKCKYCRASQQEYDREAGLESYAYALLHVEDVPDFAARTFGGDVKFDVVIGNPPYQLSDGGHSASATSIYHLFVQQAKKFDPRIISMVIPARWYSGGKGVDEFRKEMLEDGRIRVLEDFPDSNDVFPGTQIKGGVCYFLWDRDNPGPTSVRNHLSDGVSVMERPMLEPGADVFVRFNSAISILKKVSAKINGNSAGEVGFATENSFKELVSSAKPFGLRTFFKGSVTAKPNSVKVFQNGGIGYVSRNEITKGSEFVDVWKVFIPRAGSGSDSFPHPILGKPFVGAPGEVSTETYNLIGPFETEVEARNAVEYINSRLFRFLVLLHKPSQDANRNVYTFVPKLDFKRPWKDEDLYALFGIDENEQNFIELLIRPTGDNLD